MRHPLKIFEYEAMTGECKLSGIKDVPINCE
jgi:hypothetical protein